MPSKRKQSRAAAAGEMEPAGADPAVPDDLTCPLCHELLTEPVATACNHLFCRFCIGRLFDMRRPADGHRPPAERARDCPMCRRPLRLAEVQPEAALDQRAQQAFPQLAAQRRQEIAQERARLAARRLEHVKIYIGNTHRLHQPQGGSNNMHEWTFFIRLYSSEEEERYIQHVVVRLHPTFRPNTLILSQPPYAVRRLGWGIFVVTATVAFKQEWGGGTLVLHWMLEFEGAGAMREIEVEVEHQPSQGAAPAVAGASTGPAAAAGADQHGQAGEHAGGGGASGDDADEEEEGSGGAASGSDSGSSSEEDEEEEEDTADTASSDEENSYSPGHDGAGGYYVVNRSWGGGWASPGASSASEGDPPAYDPAGGGGGDQDSDAGH